MRQWAGWLILAQLAVPLIALVCMLEVSDDDRYDRAGAKVAESLRVFRCAISGDLLEPSAHVAEGYPYVIPRIRWDHDTEWLSGLLVSQYGEDIRAARPWVALPWITEHCLRHHMEWPGL